MTWDGIAIVVAIILAGGVNAIIHAVASRVTYRQMRSAIVDAAREIRKGPF